MLYDAIINKLRVDTELTNLISTYKNAPAIFSEGAPEGVNLPYIVIGISRTREDSAIHTFLISVDYYDNGSSLFKSNIASERIEIVLDNQILSNDRYDSVRVRFASADSIPDVDTRKINQSLLFTARASRKKWMKTIR